jgi:two-component system sensor histidine kinase RegB
MPAPPEPLDIGVGTQIGLVWLIRLRWGAALCQLAALVVAGSLFAMKLDTPVLLTLVGLTVATNLGLEVWSRSYAGSPWAIAAVLAFDTVLLTAFLLASGGAANPFTVLYLVHVTLAAVLLPVSWTWFVVLLSVAGFGLLFVFEGPHHEAMAHSGYGSHLQGMWIAYTTAAAVIAYFVGRLSRALQKREQELLQVRERALRNERLAALTTLAAGAAHELSTPLSTVAVVATEIQRKCEALDPNLAEDARLIRSELERCRSILEQMSAHAGEAMGEGRTEVPISTLIRSIEGSLGPLSTSVRFRQTGSRTTLSVTRQALVRVLVNLVRNGIDASPAGREVVLAIDGRTDRVVFAVTDTGSGMPPEVKDRALEPFFTTKAPGKGLGLGLFLVKSFADRLDGRLEIDSEIGRGTTVTLELPQPSAPLGEAQNVKMREGVAEG